ncbi:MAG TPA: MxaK protein [Burkholderiales bacterium]|nr:MxaK protein [Burkholderiales bacterium]
MDTVLIARRRRAWRIGAAFLVLAALAGLDLYRLSAIARWNERIATIESSAAYAPAALEPDAPMEARFALARAAAQQGEVTRAVALYRDVAHARPDLSGAALFDAANALLREADRIAASGDRLAARPLLELAKATYREALRHEAGRWDARYNLERALRAAPEDGSADDAPLPMPADSERAATTMRAFTLGLP